MKKTAEPTTGKASAVNSTQPLPCYIDILLLPRPQNTRFGVHWINAHFCCSLSF